MPGRKKSAKGKKASGKSAKGKKSGKKGAKGKGKGKSKDQKDVAPKKTPEGFALPEKGSPAEASLFLLRSYLTACAEVKAMPVPSFVAELRQLVEENKVTTRVILEEPADDIAIPMDKDSDADDDDEAEEEASASRAAAFKDSSDDESDSDSDSDDSSEDEEPVRRDSIKRREKALWPLLLALARCNYRTINAIHAWSCKISDQAASILSRHMDAFSSGPLAQLKTLDLVDCTMSVWAGRTLSRLGTEGCRCLCSGLRSNVSVQTLSLDHCGFRSSCGALLGDLLIHSAIKDLSLDSNLLECEGVCGLLRPFMEMIAPYIDFRKQLVDAEAAVAEYIAQQEASRNPYAPQRRPEEAEEDPPSMVALKALQAEIPPPPPPKLERLVISGTAMDRYAKGGKQGPAVVINLIKILITTWEPLQELHLHNNQIGDYAGCELLEGLEARKEAGFKAIYITVTPHILIDTLKAILKISAKAPAGGKKTKKKGRLKSAKKGKGKGKGKAKGKKGEKKTKKKKKK